MATLTNFFDHPLEKKISQPPPAKIPAEGQRGKTEPNPPAAAGSHACNHDLLWLDAYGSWRCKICFPPIFDSEIRGQKKTEPKPPAKNPSPENFDFGPPQVYVYLPDEPDPFSENFQSPIPGEEFLPCLPQEACDCGSLDFWWSVLGGRHCQKCFPRPARSRKLLALAGKLRRIAKLAAEREARKKP